MSEEIPTPPPSELESLRAEMRAGFVEMRTGFVDVRRYMDVVAEALREDLKVVIEKVTATDKKVDRLITSNAVEHAAFIESIADHEVRLRILEKIREGSSAP